VDVNVCVGFLNNEESKLQLNSFITSSLVVVVCFLVVIKDENLFRFISTARFSILINGSPHGFFGSSRGPSISSSLCFS